MKNFNWFLLSLFLLTGIVACEKDDNDTQEVDAKGIYIVNYGKFGSANGSISVYDEEAKQVTSNSAYKDANGRAAGSNIQAVAAHKGKLYFMSNGGDKIDIVNAKTLKVEAEPIADDIIKPRYFVAKDNFGYVSCWGGNDFGTLANGYIAKIDLENNTLAKKIALPGASEGLVIVDNKLYGAAYSSNKVFVMDLATEKISYITMNAMPQHLVVDANNNIWVSVVSTSVASFSKEKCGLQHINTSTNEVDDFVNIKNIGYNGLIQISKDKKTVYVMGEGEYPKTAVYEIDIENKKLTEEALISGESFYGMGYNQETENIYICISASFDGTAGKLNVYDKTGKLLDEQTVGATPQGVCFYYE